MANSLWFQVMRRIRLWVRFSISVVFGLTTFLAAWAQTPLSTSPQRIQWTFHPHNPWSETDNAVSASATLNGYEQQLYGHAYPDDTETHRLDRLEQSLGLAGAVASPPGERLQQLAQHFQQWSQQPVNNRSVSMVTYLEQHLLKTTYTHNPLPQRLSRLEMLCFGHAFTQEEPSIRLQRLFNRIPLETRALHIMPSTEDAGETAQPYADKSTSTIYFKD